jgi:UDP-N-acetylmuramate dehydrogenase
MQTLPFDFAVENYPLASLTLYNIGGPARLALLPRTVDEAAAAYEWMIAQGGRSYVLGGGSNVLIDDAGLDGIVLITNELQGLEPLGEDRYRIESGVVLDDVVAGVMLANNYAMVGGLTGIPGSVGGAIYMNAGTNKGWTCMVMDDVDVITPDGRQTIPMHESLYNYRGQKFCPPGGLILQGTFRFAAADEPQQPIYDRYKARRLEVQPQGHCCGSVFKNPEGTHAGRLIEACGLKGTRHGGAVISDLHANFIMNETNATSADVLALIAIVKETVKGEHGIDLQEEVVYLR